MKIDRTLYIKGRTTNGQISPLKGIIAATGSSPCIAIVGEVTGWDMTQNGGEFVSPVTHRVVVVVEPQPDGAARKGTMVLSKGDVIKAVQAYDDALARKDAGQPVAPVAAPAPAPTPVGDNSDAILAGVKAGTVTTKKDVDGLAYFCAKTGALLAYDVVTNHYVHNSKDAWTGGPDCVGSTKKLVLTDAGKQFA